MEIDNINDIYTFLVACCGPRLERLFVQLPTSSCQYRPEDEPSGSESEENGSVEELSEQETTEEDELEEELSEGDDPEEELLEGDDLEEALSEGLNTRKSCQRESHLKKINHRNMGRGKRYLMEGNQRKRQ
ncbi:hypothetical protein TRIUR3_11329 [Triticum urartu]|uniref:Uncharacterized protein n=2 Tax=Triticum urartu TaxID=4572 RepID=M7ZSS0_TRIUA|nr:hypothetical protein TRIUR3_11329 [Triticum urartu]